MGEASHTGSTTAGNGDAVGPGRQIALTTDCIGTKSRRVVAFARAWHTRSSVDRKSLQYDRRFLRSAGAPGGKRPVGAPARDNPTPTRQSPTPQKRSQHR